MYALPQKWTLSRIWSYTFLILKCTFWYIVLELILHYFYFSAISKEDPNLLVQHLDLWTLSGLGYGFGQYFHLKYLIFYGISQPFLMADGIVPQENPKCIGRIHLYSDMWRSFDPGLHQFLQRYIYIPMREHLPQNLMGSLITTTICFTFVCFWHFGFGSYDIFIWCGINCFAIICEIMAKNVWKNETYHKIEVRMKKVFSFFH